MRSGAVARRYARALFELAAEAGSVDDVAAALGELAAAVESLEPGALAPGLLTSGQRQSLADALVQKVGRDGLVGRFVAVLAGNDRLEQVPGIRESFEKLQDAAAGRVRIAVRSAAPLSDAERQSLRQTFEKVTSRKVLDSMEVVPELLGGLTVEAEGRVYDGSIRTQLARLERRMSGQAG